MNMDSFQQIIFKLKSYWAAQNCVIQEPYDGEVGAGTMAPETFLRVLGPDPYRVAYVQPSRRPADGRYGENPNRLYKHQQLQVILKPSPDNLQELYLGSLDAIGIDTGYNLHSPLSCLSLPDFMLYQTYADGQSATHHITSLIPETLKEMQRRAN